MYCSKDVEKSGLAVQERSNLNVKAKDSWEVIDKVIFASEKAEVTGPHAPLNETLASANPLQEAFPGRVPVKRAHASLKWKLTNIKNVNTLVFMMDFNSLDCKGVEGRVEEIINKVGNRE